jgi:hypothetical protein
MSLRQQLAFLQSHIMVLPYERRVEAMELIRKHKDKGHLSQMQQLTVDQLIEKIHELRLASKRIRGA